ncbi:MAG: Hsp20/alpha crystallin family protein [Candidatus Cloacimonetes bacterium]|jgi:HSP20 family protein|nr:Hsp20/alpha crystallin family protein [Candidatus Cloacimonadota bacterium]
MQDKIISNLQGIRRQMLKILGEVSSLTNSPMAIEEAIDDYWHPKCDVFQTDTQWIVVVELAGVEKDEIIISVTPEFLRISGLRNLHEDNSHAFYHSMEIETGRFDRRIFFPDISIDKENPKVQYHNGILKISFSLSATVERIIPIQ